MSNKHGSNWVRKDLRYAIYHRDSWTCQYCGANLSYVPNRYRTLDHVTPRNLGGGNEASNLVTCCKPCNDSKGDKIYPAPATVHMPIDRAVGKRIAALERATR